MMTNSHGVTCSAPDLTDEFVSGLCWLAFLVTENWHLSIDVVCSVLDPDELYESFSRQGMILTSRRRVAAAAIARIRAQLPESAHRTARTAATDWALSKPFSADSSPGLPLTKPALQQALLAIDKFPRCALLLIVFEGLSIGKAALLLEESEALVRDALGLALIQLTRNLTGRRDWNCSPAGSRN